jgi:hypothetical protein
MGVGCMKQTQFDKHTIAWFKIAECVSRGEKERALGVYRLLSHSFNDGAVARQLEADIYWSFDEQDQAITLYHHAMELYQKSHRFLEAVAVGEHLVVMCPADSVLRRTVIMLYISLGMIAKIDKHIQVLIYLLGQKQQWYEIKNIVLDFGQCRNDSNRGVLYSALIVVSYTAGCPWDIVASCIEIAVEDLSQSEDKNVVQTFSLSLQACADELYNYAVKSLTIYTKE